MSFITSVATANPQNKFAQQQIADFMVKAMALNSDEEQHLRVLFRATGIETRYSVLQDYGSTEQFTFFPNNKQLEPFPSTKKRLKYYEKEAIALSVQAATRCINNVPNLKAKDITHIIAVSCTGMFAPGLDISLIQELGLRTTITRTSINFMGCYAAFNALRLAHSFCNENPQSKVLVVCTELCSLHFQKEKTEDNILANALFADGSAALLVEAQSGSGIALRIDDFFSDLIPDGEGDMAWSIGDIGFEMKLSTYVPELIKKGILKLTESLMNCNHLELSQISYFAVHPGGKKILEAIESELGLDHEDNYYAYSVLKRYGNMSSPTIVFVLDEMIRKLNSNDHDKKVLCFGFGPGLTLESMLLTISSN